MKELRYPNLREAMLAVQKQRSGEVGGHTWEQMVERYGIAILFGEIASITLRLESVIWGEAWNPYSNPHEVDIDRLLDLCIDLGNYTEFLYIAIQDWEEKNKLTSNKGPGKVTRDFIEKSQVRAMAPEEPE